MSAINIINMLEKAENMMSIYRNYASYRKYCKMLILFRIFGEMCINIAVFINDWHLIKMFTKSITDLGYLFVLCHFIDLCNTLIVMISSILGTAAYKDFKTNLSVVHRIYNSETNYIKGLRRLNIIAITWTTLYFIVEVPLSILRIGTHIYFTGTLGMHNVIILILSEIFYEARFILERLVLYSYITITYNLVKCLNLSVCEALLNVNQSQHEAAISVAQIKQWADRYQGLVNCVKRLSTCFQHQVTFSIATTTLYYISFSYAIFTIFITQAKDKYMSAVNFMWDLICYIFSMYMVFYAGEKLDKEAVTLRRVLSKLYSTLSRNPESPQMKMIKDLKLVTTVDSIKIEFVKSKLGMYLIPMILSITVSYVIIALQFNNII